MISKKIYHHYLKSNDSGYCLRVEYRIFGILVYQINDHVWNTHNHMSKY